MILRDVLMVAFFTTVGMSASLRLVRQGGRQVLLFLLVAATGIVLENIPLTALLAGSVSMAGGPATAIAFGGTFESLGAEGRGRWVWRRRFSASWPAGCWADT
jgi:ESS family glutamate:Na+ symporter